MGKDMSNRLDEAYLSTENKSEAVILENIASFNINDNESFAKVYQDINQLTNQLIYIKDKIMFSQNLSSYIDTDEYYQDFFKIHYILQKMDKKLKTIYQLATNDNIIDLINRIMHELNQLIYLTLDEIKRMKDRYKSKYSYQIICGIVYSNVSNGDCIENIKVMELLLFDVENLIQQIMG